MRVPTDVSRCLSGEAPLVSSLAEQDLTCFSEELGQLLTEVKKRLRGCKFGRPTNAAWPAWQANTAYVYYEDSLLALGCLRYGDYQKSVEGEDKFVVESRTIHNERYDRYDKGYHMVSSKNLKTAVKNACTQLRPWGASELATYLWTKLSINREWREGRYDIVSAVNTARRAIGSTETVVAELLHLYTAGHTFMDTSVRELVANYSDAHKACEEDRQERQHGIAFVYGKEDAVSVVHKARADFDPYLKNGAHYVRNDPFTGGSATYNHAELPEDISGRVAALSMCESGAFVDKVGFRVAENCFYVYTD